MRKIPLSSVRPGDEVAVPIKIRSSRPDVLYRLRISAGSELTQKDINRLEKLEVNYVTVRDPDTDDLDKYVFDEKLEQAQEEVVDEFNRIVDMSQNNELTGDEIKQLRDTIKDLIEAIKDTHVMAAFTSLKTHDNYTARHSMDVTKISLHLALPNEAYFRKRLMEESGASSDYVNRNLLTDLAMGAMLHDIGKKVVPSGVLSKPDSLTSEEWDLIQKHPREGYDVLKEINHDLNAPVKVPALQHHEKYDGSGYPRGLEENDIHLYGRICAPADVYSALTSNRAYRKERTPAQALEIMHYMQEEGPHFDPEIFERFLDIVLPYPVGMDVTLSDGSEGVICDVDRDNPLQPTVRVLSRDGERLDTPVEVTMGEDINLEIETEAQALS